MRLASTYLLVKQWIDNRSTQTSARRTALKESSAALMSDMLSACRVVRSAQPFDKLKYLGHGASKLH
jgi:hypothetical protein